jgi:hypothetical protein
MTIPENLSKLENLYIYADNLTKLNLPENTNKLESLSNIQISCKKLNNEINFPNNIEDLFLTLEEDQVLTIPEAIQIAVNKVILDYDLDESEENLNL